MRETDSDNIYRCWGVSYGFVLGMTYVLLFINLDLVDVLHVGSRRSSR